MYTYTLYILIFVINGCLIKYCDDGKTYYSNY